MEIRETLHLAERLIRSVGAQTLGRGGPLAVRWNLTRHCPLRCVYCGAAGKQPEGPELSPAQAQDLLAALARAGVIEVSFSGGEPLTRADLPDLAKRARRLGMRPSVNTSGVLLARHIERVRAMTRIKVSLDGREATHDALRGTGVYRAACEGLQAAGRSWAPAAPGDDPSRARIATRRTLPTCLSWPRAIRRGRFFSYTIRTATSTARSVFCRAPSNARKWRIFSPPGFFMATAAWRMIWSA